MQNDVSGNRDGLWYLILFVILATPPPLNATLVRFQRLNISQRLNGMVVSGVPLTDLYHKTIIDRDMMSV